MNRKKGSNASINRKKIRTLKLYLVVYLTGVITLLVPHQPTHSPALTRTMKDTLVEPKEYAYKTAYSTYGWGKSEQKCLGILWGKESAWNFEAKSPTHDYGIPQRHMRQNTKTEIADFMESPVTQIDWGLNYIKVRYGSPCKAWEFWQVRRWY